MGQAIVDDTTKTALKSALNTIHTFFPDEMQADWVVHLRAMFFTNMWENEDPGPLQSIAENWIELTDPFPIEQLDHQQRLSPLTNEEYRLIRDQFPSTWKKFVSDSIHYFRKAPADPDFPLGIYQAMDLEDEGSETSLSPHQSIQEAMESSDIHDNTNFLAGGDVSKPSEGMDIDTWWRKRSCWCCKKANVNFLSAVKLPLEWNSKA